MKTNKQPYLKKLTHIYDEITNVYLPVVDKVVKFKKLSKSSSAVFFKKKRIEKLTALRYKKRQVKIKPPVPGGVGYGIYFKQKYQWAFTNFSALDFGLLFPISVGGDSKNFLYLTSTNGTSKGVEALLSYLGQDPPQFKIFDWSKPDAKRWSLSVDITQLQENITILNLQGIEHQLLRILNKTEKVSPDFWENKVYLFNFTNQNWDLVYTSQYACTLSSQKHVSQGSWGPIIETFQTQFSEINPLGFYRCQLYNDAKDPKLTPKNSTIRNDDDGIDAAFNDPNWIFYVT